MMINDFPAFYFAVHRRSPFRWQVELLKRVINDGWPDTIQLPTSSGKTSTIDIAVFLLALDAGKTLADRRAAIRTFFVVDRRIVVDEAYEHALKIAGALKNPADQTTKDVASQLQLYGGQLPLQVSRMRGGMFRDSGWADEPNQPLICLSTVDQVGSRLMFRGYQVNNRTRSVHAGLAGIDSMLILDEAHLSNAFAETVKALSSRYTRSTEKFPKLVTMSATAKEGADTFFMKPEWIEEDHQFLKPRLTASKPAKLREPQKRFEDELVAIAKEFGSGRKTGAVGVICNTIKSAREVFGKASGDKVLFIGRNRPWCAEKLWERHKDRIEARPDRISQGLFYVVATQTVEVGANISFDALVTESAPIDALRQRFGRLNRLGLVTESNAAIVVRPKGDQVYGDRTDATWEFLKANEPIDFGVLAMDRTLGNRDITPMLSRRSQAPLIFPGHLELWSQTNPAPEPDPDVAPFLHGPEALESADVQIVWRGNLHEGNSKEWPALINLAPPVSREALPMPIAAVKRWLRGFDTSTSDIEGIPSEPLEQEDRKNRQPRPLVFWTSDGAKLGDDTAVRPGQTIVVPTAYSGADEFGWNPDSVPLDIFDEVNSDEAERGLRKRIIRLDILAKNREDLQSLIKSWQVDPERDETKILEALLITNPDARIDRSGSVITWPSNRPASAIEPITTEYDETDDNSFTRKCTLKTHTEGVVQHARRYAIACGLPSMLVDDIVLAARLHDWGKCDERFQAWLAGEPFRGDEYLAKSSGERTWAEDRRLRTKAGYPEQARHEAGSVMAAGVSGLLTDAHDPDLVLHLIGSHHGWGRPWFPVWDGDPDFRVIGEAEGRSFECSDGLELASVDSGWVDRFTSLNNKYGYWGLAHLEAILRRADCMQSRREAGNVAN